MKSFSIVIPIYNEAEILEKQIEKLLKKLRSAHIRSPFEIILIENGSTDNTFEIAKRLEEKHVRIKVLQLHAPSYGQAFKEGIRASKYPIVVQFDLDFWDIFFLQKALLLMRRFDIVIGSKNLLTSHDQRTAVRRFASKTVEIILQYRFKVSMSDTHGLKVIRKDKIIELIDHVWCNNHFFDSELLIRSCKLGASFMELPVNLKEIRASRFAFLVRFRQVIVEFMQLLMTRIPVSMDSYRVFIPKRLSLSA